jgi:hypothetical protein
MIPLRRHIGRAFKVYGARITACSTSATEGNAGGEPCPCGSLNRVTTVTATPANRLHQDASGVVSLGINNIRAGASRLFIIETDGYISSSSAIASIARDRNANEGAA